MQTSYLTSPYSPFTWTAARESLDNRQTALARSKFTSARKLVEPGTVFLCYVIGEKEVVGALRAESEAYLDDDDSTRALILYPVRVKTSVIARCELGAGVKLQEIRENSSDPRRWIGLVQGALKRVPPEDGDWIVSRLKALA